MSRQVTYIVKRGDNYNPHERIQAIGGSGWSRLEDDAINDVLRDPQSYYTSVGGYSVWVIVASHNGRNYLKTQNDGYSPDNLLSLPGYPA